MSAANACVVVCAVNTTVDDVTRWMNHCSLPLSMMNMPGHRCCWCRCCFNRCRFCILFNKSKTHSKIYRIEKMMIQHITHAAIWSKHSHEWSHNGAVVKSRLRRSARFSTQHQHFICLTENKVNQWEEWESTRLCERANIDWLSILVISFLLAGSHSS